MQSTTGIKATITIMLTALGVYFHNIATPLLILTITMILDYITGMTNAWLTKTLSSQKGITGIVKKVLYIVVIAVAMIADYLIVLMTKEFGIKIPAQATVIALVVTIWLILNESISILENLAKIGTPMPKFLLKLIERLKDTTEKQGDNIADGGEEPEAESDGDNG